MRPFEMVWALDQEETQITYLTVPGTPLRFPQEEFQEMERRTLKETVLSLWTTDVI